MSDITKLKKAINQKLSEITNKAQLNNILRVLDRMELLEQALMFDDELPMGRGEDTDSLKANLNLASLPETAEGETSSMKDLLENAFLLMSDMEEKLNK